MAPIRNAATPVPMPAMVIGVLLGYLLMGVLFRVFGFPTIGLLVVTCATAPFTLWWLFSNRSDDGNQFVERPSAVSPAGWGRRGVIGLMVLAFLFGQPGVPYHTAFLAVAVALLVILLATPRWGGRYPPLAWAVVLVQFDLPETSPGLFLLSLLGVAALPRLVRGWRGRVSDAPGSR